MEYITFMRKNTTSDIREEEWTVFFDLLNKSDAFRGGSLIRSIDMLGDADLELVTKGLAGYMRFYCKNLEELKSLLSQHPVIKHGGSIEICEMPKG